MRTTALKRRMNSHGSVDILLLTGSRWARGFRRSGAEIPHPSPRRPISAQDREQGAGIGLLGLRNDNECGVELRGY